MKSHLKFVCIAIICASSLLCSSQPAFTQGSLNSKITALVEYHLSQTDKTWYVPDSFQMSDAEEAKDGTKRIIVYGTGKRKLGFLKVTTYYKISVKLVLDDFCVEKVYHRESEPYQVNGLWDR